MQNKRRFRQFVLSDGLRSTEHHDRIPDVGCGNDSSSPVQSVGPWEPHTLTMLQQSFRSTGRPVPTANGTDNVERHLQQRIRQCNMVLRHSGNLTFNFHVIPEFTKDVLYQYRTRCIYCASYIPFILSI
jgi:hypothetical protein